MHELVKNEKKESRARPLQHTRTGPTASNSMSLSAEEKQQKRIAARAATAMAQVLQRRREPRSLMMWGDRKKAIIKNYPDGKQEIIVPQTLTAEQEHYEFPPRSRFLKKLATSTAERKRLSILQDQIVPCPTVVLDEMKQPDQLALQEWFSKKDDISKLNKDKVVIDWMNDVERSSKNILSKHTVKPSPTPSACYSNKIQFKSDAGKRWANSITSNTSLVPPSDTCRKHYVPRRLLTKPIVISHDITMAAVSKIEKIWKDYQNTNRSSPTNVENQIGMTAMATTGQRTPISGMAQLIQMMNTSKKQQEQRYHDRAEELETVLHQETNKRQLAEDTMKKLENVYKQQLQQQSLQTDQKEEAYQTLLSKVTELEQSMKRDSQSRRELSDQLFQTTNLSSTRMPSIAPLPRPSTVPTKKPSMVPASKRNSTVPAAKRNSTVPAKRNSTVPAKRISTVPAAQRPSLVSAQRSTKRPSLVSTKKPTNASAPERKPSTSPAPLKKPSSSRPSVVSSKPTAPLSRRPTVVPGSPATTITSKKQSILSSTRTFARPSLATKTTSRLL